MRRRAAQVERRRSRGARSGSPRSQGPSSRVDSGMKRNTITGVSIRVLASTLGTSGSVARASPNRIWKASETGKNASQMAMACFQRGGAGLPAGWNQRSRPVARCSWGASKRPWPRASQARREAECSQVARVSASRKRKMI